MEQFKQLTNNRKKIMTNTITIPANILRASLITSAIKDIRYYLNSVCIVATATYTKAISTDGNRLSLIGNKEENTLDSAKVTILVPTDIIKMIDSKDVNVTFTQLNDAATEWNMEVVNNKGSKKSINFTPVDGKFPDYARVIRAEMPKGEAQITKQFNPEYLADCVKQFKILGCKTFPVVCHGHEENTALRVTMRDNEHYLCILMPIRSDKPTSVSHELTE